MNVGKSTIDDSHDICYIVSLISIPYRKGYIRNGSVMEISERLKHKCYPNAEMGCSWTGHNFAWVTVSECAAYWPCGWHGIVSGANITEVKSPLVGDWRFRCSGRALGCWHGIGFGV